MDASLIEALKTLAGGIFVPIASIAGAVYTIQRVKKNFEKDRAAHDAKIIQESKELVEKLKADTKVETDNIKRDLKNLEDNVNKDLNHLKETYNGEIRNLGQKIEELKTELRTQHQSLVGLLTKMIDNID